VRKYGDAILPIRLDGADRVAAAQQAHAQFGRLDVVVNNGAAVAIAALSTHLSTPGHTADFGASPSGRRASR
jgi:NAD(P)-dependent dehydrogenase (short-subunit alcohol dehydrogenase family)